MTQATYEMLKATGQALTEANCGRAIQELEVYLSAWPEPQTARRLFDIKADYEMMASYWQQGGEDPQRGEIYQRLLQRVYVLYANICHYHRVQRSGYLHSIYSGARQDKRDWTLTTIRHSLEDFVSTAALLQLEPENKRQQKSAALYHTHQQQMSQLFGYVLTSRQWSDGVGQEFGQMLCSPTIDSNDQQLIVSAVMLSLMNQFDMAKFRMLTTVYQQSQDEAVRQRALVGWVLSASNDYTAIYPEQQDIIRQLTSSEAVCNELTELQMQLIYSLHAEHDTNTIRHEIMPDLLKNNTLHITINGIEESDDDPLEDVLHPDAAEERMEKLEASFQRMMDMQKQGADIYFGGFSQMKRFPFFYDISNWLVPFYAQHPDIAQYVGKLAGNLFVEKLIQRGPFCNSDKYSFIIAFQQVMDRLPENMQQMLKRGEASLGPEESEPEQTPAYIRRIYLMDLYRFFRLFPQRGDLYNPFDTSLHEAAHVAFIGNPLFDGTPLEEHKHQIVRLLKKKHMEQAASDLLQTFKPAQHDLQYFLWTRQYEQALQLAPDDERALQGHARSLFSQQRYEEAYDEYLQLSLRRPEKAGYQLNAAVCLANMNSYEQAQKELFRLSYEHPDDHHVKRVLAWVLTCAGKARQATPLYEELTSVEEPSHEDLKNYGLCLWLQNDISAATARFRQYCQAVQTHPDHIFSNDQEWLNQRRITDTEIKMMIAAIAAL